MKKLIVIIFLSVLAVGASRIAADARTFHLFFIDQKETFSVDGVDYSAWKIGPRYYMQQNDARPEEGQQVHNVVSLLASAGNYDMIYIGVNDVDIATAATKTAEYAGGGITYGNAWVDFVIRSYEQIGVHSGFAAGTAARKILRVRWLDGEEWAAGSLEEWIAAGKPTNTMNVNVAIRIFGVE